MADPHRRFAAFALVIVLGLTGCSGAATAGAPSPTASDSAVVQLPVGFPKDVPLLQGAILHVAHPGNIWAVWVASADLVGDLAAATTLLAEAGYAQTTAGDGWAQFEGNNREVRVIAAADDKYGDSLAYTLTDSVASG